jgi:hypothetical protein
MIIDILKEIHRGHDGIIRSINFHSFDIINVEISAFTSVEIVIKQKPKREWFKANWINVQFAMKGILEFCVMQKNGYSNVVLSDGISYKIVDGINYIDFCAHDTDGIDDFRRSEIYFACRSIECKIIPYREIDKDGNFQPAPSAT